MVTDERFVGLFKVGQIVCISVVSERDGQVAEGAAPPGAFDRTALESLIKLDG